MSQSTTMIEQSDLELIARVRSGDGVAFDELWARHARSALRVARQFGAAADADALVADASATIRGRIEAGGGPDGGFRPYLYSTIRGLAEARGAGRTAEPDAAPESRMDSLDRAITARAYRSLPARWQTALWYAEVEGLDPREIAPIMGMTVEGTAALLHRAREGLRSAWLRAHADEAADSADCRWAIVRLGAGTRDALPAADRTRLDAHVDGCARCTVLAERVHDVGMRLALAVVPLVLGAGAVIGTATATAAVASTGAAAGTTAAAGAAAASGTAAAVVAGGTAAGTAVGAAAAATAATAGTAVGGGLGVPAVVSGLAAVAVVGGAVSVGPAATPAPVDDPPAAVSVAAAPPIDPLEVLGTPQRPLVVDATPAPEPSAVPVTLGGAGTATVSVPVAPVATAARPPAPPRPAVVPRVPAAPRVPARVPVVPAPPPAPAQPLSGRGSSGHGKDDGRSRGSGRGGEDEEDGGGEDD